MKYILFLIFTNFYVSYNINVYCFVHEKHRNLLYNSYNPMKRRLSGLKEDESSTDLNHDNPYRFVNGFRIVVPYTNLYKTHVKERWLGKPLYKVFTDEFSAFSDDYIKFASSRNKIKVFDKDNKDIYKDNKSNILDHVLKSNEKIFHYASVHEPIALHTQIRVLHDDHDYIVVSKPTSIPVYHTGTYHYNTLVEIMNRELDSCKILKLYPCHRIDRLVSGIVAFAKNPNAASKLSQHIRDGIVKKVYIARVCGNFSDLVKTTEPYEVDDTVEDGILNKVLSFEGFIHPISKKQSKYEFTKESLDESYKHSITRFRFLSYNKDIDQSLILCSPITGRTHQLRVHLKYLGHPISNDPCYNNGSIVDSSEYFQGIPTIKWELDKEGNWCIPDLGLFEDCNIKPDFEESKYHVGLNNKSDLNAKVPSGIFLHALRFSWDKNMEIADKLPKWVDKFDFDSNLCVNNLNLW